jgi:hypothetical protein
MISVSDYPEPPPDNGEPRYLVYDKIMISAIISLLVAFLVFLLYVYARWFSGRFFRRTRRRSASTGARFYFSGEEPERLWNVGLDSAILGTLPMFLYQSQNFTDGLECAVCLCEFEENEKGRLLPNCRHSFHVECIDMWFRSHSTCPICRIGAQPEQPVLESGRTEQVSVTIPGPITSGFQDNLNLQQEQSARCGEDYNLQKATNIFSWGRQKHMKTEMDEGTSGGRAVMPQIAIEIPKRPNGFSSPGEGHQPGSANGSQRSSRPPVTRLRSLTRMVSRNRERTPAERDAENNES